MKRCLLLLLAASLALAACTQGFFPTPTSTVVPATPTPTPEPLAASVNGQGILLSDYQDEVARFETAQAALGTDLASLGDYRSRVLQALVDRRLLAQAAQAAGKTFEDAEVDAEIESLAESRGGNEAMGAWMADNHFTLDSLKRALRDDKLSAMMVETIAQGVGDRAEQVHAAHILVATRPEAEALQAQLASGADFAELARSASLDPSTRPAGGDLGWSPRGYLLVPEVDQAAWALAAGETSDIVQSALGYHIVRVLERGEHPLSPDARRFLRDQAVQEWLKSQRATAQVEIYAAP